MNKREIIQRKAVDLFKNNSKLVLEWATGCGKSKATIDIIKTLNSKSKILLVVSEIAHKTTWLDEFKKWNLSYKVTLTTYASLHKYVDKEFELVILDEGHHINTEIKLDIINNIKFDNLLVLSATLTDSFKINLHDLFGEFHYYTISLLDAFEEGILEKPSIKVIYLSLDNTIKDQSIIFSRGVTSKRVKVECDFNQRWKYMTDKKNYPNLHLTIRCTKREKYNDLCDKIDYAKKRYLRDQSPKNKNIWLKKGLDRKNFLGESKTEVAKEIINHLKNLRYLCFCSSIKQSNSLNKKNSINSKVKNTENIIDRFQKNKISNLFVVNMLQEGANINNIEAGVIIQLDGKERPFIQKSGRTLRAEFPLLILPVYKDTKDTDYLMNVINNTPEECIEFLNRNEICKI